MKKIMLFFVLMCVVSTTAFAATPCLAHRHCHGDFGSSFAGTAAGVVAGVLAIDLLRSCFSRPAPVAVPVPAYYYTNYVFNPYTQCYQPCYY